MIDEAPVEVAARRGSTWEVFLVFLRLGVTSFGGPIAHLGYFRDEIVTRRRWIGDREYGDLVALAQFLPGPASSQVGFGIGLLCAGWKGALAAFFAFTMPSAILMVAFAYGAALFEGPVGQGILEGLTVVAVAIVAQAVWGMARSLAPLCVGSVRVSTAGPTASPEHHASAFRRPPSRHTVRTRRAHQRRLLVRALTTRGDADPSR